SCWRIAAAAFFHTLVSIASWLSAAGVGHLRPLFRPKWLFPLSLVPGLNRTVLSAKSRSHRMNHDLSETIALLSRTPAQLNALLRDLPVAWTPSNEGPATWTAFDIVGHLIHAECTDWIPRATMIVQHGESQTFKPFDREGQYKESQGKSLPELLDEFASARAQSLSQLHALNLQASDLSRRGCHPNFGSVTLGQLLATWVVHDLT